MSRQIFGGTDKGLVRPNNQDRFEYKILSESMSFSVVCDGMGGENGGGTASTIASEFAFKTLERDLSEEMTELSIRAVFSSVFSAANALIYDMAQKHDELKGMGTTMVLAVIKDSYLFIGSVGDSRAYLSSPEEDIQITKDHTIVQMMVDSGELSNEEAQSHPKRHFITRAVGVSETVEMDFYVAELKEDDITLICSDGLYAYLDFQGIYELLLECTEQENVEPLISIAKNGGGADNITAVIMV